MPYFDGRRGRVFHDSWQPTGDVGGVVVLLHGYGEHLGLYDAFARRLGAESIAVHALDFAGHGRSDGPRAVVETWDDCVADALTLVGIVQDRHPGLPLALVGHSGGALTAALTAARAPQVAQAVVLSGGVLLPLRWVDEELATGNAETEGGEPVEFLSRHGDYAHQLVNDPLTWKGGFRREMLLALRAAWPEVAVALADGRPDCPVLVVHGSADPIAPVEHARQVAGLLPQARLAVFEGDLHDVLNEHDRDTVHDVVAGFLGETVRTARGLPSAAGLMLT